MNRSALFWLGVAAGSAALIYLLAPVLPPFLVAAAVATVPLRFAQRQYRTSHYYGP